MEKLFKKKWGTLLGVGTLVDGKSDVLVAKWEPEKGDTLVESVIVWNAPEYDITLFKCKPDVAGSVESMKKILLETYGLQEQKNRSHKL